MAYFTVIIAHATKLRIPITKQLGIVNKFLPVSSTIVLAHLYEQNDDNTPNPPSSPRRR